MPHCGKRLLLDNLLCSDLGLGQRMQFAQLKRRAFIQLLGGSQVGRSRRAGEPNICKGRRPNVEISRNE